MVCNLACNTAFSRDETDHAEELVFGGIASCDYCIILAVFSVCVSRFSLDALRCCFVFHGMDSFSWFSGVKQVRIAVSRAAVFADFVDVDFSIYLSRHGNDITQP